MEKSNLDVAHEYLLRKNSQVGFLELWEEVCRVQGYETTDTDRKSKFYTNLFMDVRFITLGDNIWDLRDNYTFDRVHIDMNDVYHNEEDDEEEISEEESLDDEDEEDELDEDEDDSLDEDEDEDEDDLDEDEEDEF